MNISILPQEVQNRLQGIETAKFTDLEIVFMLQKMGVCTQSTKFKIGDFIAAELAISRGIFIIFQASDTDIKRYSNKGRNYYIFNISSVF